jgi:hypothetical protein
MLKRIIAGAALASAPLAALEAAQPPAPPAAAQPAAAQPVPQAALDPARLAAAERMLAALWPDELLIGAIEAAVAQGIPGLPMPAAPAAAAGDPYAAERTRLTQQAMRAEYGRFVRSFAPELRTLSARFYARRLGVAELEAATRFYSSPAGRRLSTGSFALVRHAEALQGMPPPQPDAELLAAFARLGTRIETETAHLAPPPPPPPPPPTRAERRQAEREAREERRAAGRRDRDRDPEFEAMADEAPAAPPAPPAPPSPPPQAADPARLAAARRAAAAIWSDEAFAQPLPLGATVDSVLALPVSAFVSVVPIPGIPPHASLGQALGTYDRNAPEGARIVSRILSEELPRILPRAAPMFRQGIAELYAREFTVAELNAVSDFYESAPGRALARETFTAVVDPEFVRGSLLVLPRVSVEALGSMIRIGQATAHLPPPPAPPAPPPAAAASPANGGEAHADHDED